MIRAWEHGLAAVEGASGLEPATSCRAQLIPVVKPVRPADVKAHICGFDVPRIRRTETGSPGWRAVAGWVQGFIPDLERFDDGMVDLATF